MKNVSVIGSKYNVCDNTIRKWIKNYNKYSKPYACFISDKNNLIII